MHVHVWLWWRLRMSCIEMFQYWTPWRPQLSPAPMTLECYITACMCGTSCAGHHHSPLLCNFSTLSLDCSFLACRSKLCSGHPHFVFCVSALSDFTRPSLQSTPERHRNNTSSISQSTATQAHRGKPGQSVPAADQAWCYE